MLDILLGSLYNILSHSLLQPHMRKGFPDGSVGKESSWNVGDTRNVALIPGSGRSPDGGNSNLLQYSCLENSMDRGAWWATVCGVAKSHTWLSTHACMHTYEEISTQGKVNKSYSQGRAEITPMSICFKSPCFCAVSLWIFSTVYSLFQECVLKLTWNKKTLCLVKYLLIQRAL